jgi:hypothetical protein
MHKYICMKYTLGLWLRDIFKYQVHNVLYLKLCKTLWCLEIFLKSHISERRLFVLYEA